VDKKSIDATEVVNNLRHRSYRFLVAESVTAAGAEQGQGNINRTLPTSLTTIAPDVIRGIRHLLALRFAPAYDTSLPFLGAVPGAFLCSLGVVHAEPLRCGQCEGPDEVGSRRGRAVGR